MKRSDCKVRLREGFSYVDDDEWQFGDELYRVQDSEGRLWVYSSDHKVRIRSRACEKSVRFTLDQSAKNGHWFVSLEEQAHAKFLSLGLESPYELKENV